MSDILAKAIRNIQRAGGDQEELADALSSLYGLEQIDKLCELSKNKILEKSYTDLPERLYFDSLSKVRYHLNKDIQRNQHRYRSTNILNIFSDSYDISAETWASLRNEDKNSPALLNCIKKRFFDVDVSDRLGSDYYIAIFQSSSSYTVIYEVHLLYKESDASLEKRLAKLKEQDLAAEKALKEQIERDQKRLAKIEKERLEIQKRIKKRTEK